MCMLWECTLNALHATRRHAAHCAIPACKGVRAALRSISVEAGVPVAVIRHKDGPSRAVGSLRTGLALPLVVPRMEAVGLLLTLSTDVVIILLPWLTPPTTHTFIASDSVSGHMLVTAQHTQHTQHTTAQRISSHLSSAQLSSAQLSSAQLSSAQLSSAQLSTAHIGNCRANEPLLRRIYAST